MRGNAVFDRSQDLASSPTKSPGADVLRTIGAGLAVFALAWGSLTLVMHTGRVAPIWPANALVLVCLLRSRVRRWPVFILAGFLGNVAADLLASTHPSTA